VFTKNYPLKFIVTNEPGLNPALATKCKKAAAFVLRPFALGKTITRNGGVVSALLSSLPKERLPQGIAPLTSRREVTQ
jgi:hypothetical protein